MSDFRKEVKHLVRSLKKAGYPVEYKKGKYKLYSRDYNFITDIHRTPGDWRAMKNLEARLKERGVEI